MSQLDKKDVDKKAHQALIEQILIKCLLIISNIIILAAIAYMLPDAIEKQDASERLVIERHKAILYD